jgi:phage-related protein (TIGR01555 family)
MDFIRAQDAASKLTMAKMATADGFDNFLSRVGLNNDNQLSASTYTLNLVTRNRILLEAAYRGSWIVGRVIDSIARDMTRAGIEITTSDRADLKVLYKAMSRMQIWQSTETGIKWGNLYGGAIGVLQIEGQNLATPLNLETVAKGQFKGMTIFDRWQLNPVLTPLIPVGPEMGLPMYYQIVSTPMTYSPATTTQMPLAIVHHSRIVRFTGIDLPFYQAITENLWGESVLERLWDRLISFDNATLSAAQLIDRANLRTVGIEGLREIIAAGGAAQQGLEAMFEMMRLMQSNEGLTLLDKNDTYQSTAYSFAGLDAILLQFGQQLAGASETPLVILFGQSPAGLSATGESDIRNYYDSVNAKQESKLRNPMEKILKIMWRSVFGAPAPDDLEFTFTPLWQMSAMDKAVIAKTNTESIIGAHTAGLVSTPTSMKELQNISGDTGLFSNITEEEIAEAELEPPPMPDAPTEEDPSKEPVKNLDSKSAWKIIRWLKKQ